MNKPATKEPSMDEILSSIRQIIADDDASVAPTPAPSARARASALPIPRIAPEPLALSPSQMIPPKPVSPAPQPVAESEAEAEPQAEPEAEAAAAADFSAMLADLDGPAVEEPEPMAEAPHADTELLDPEDVTFMQESDAVAPPPVARVSTAGPDQAARPAAAVAFAAPMPDPSLSSDMAEQLLAPATDAVVQRAMARLGGLSNNGIGGMTVEGVIRDMLRPMLKDWLDENLPSLVESMVEKEIARVSRGVK